MTERIKCPITLGEYNAIIKKESCDCATDCEICKCKNEVSLVSVYDSLDENHLKLVDDICDKLNINGCYDVCYKIEKDEINPNLILVTDEESYTLPFTIYNFE